MQVHLVSIKVSIIRITHTLVKPEGSVRLHHRIVSHHADFMKTGLSVEQHHVPVLQVPLYFIPWFQQLCYFVPVCKLQELLYGPFFVCLVEFGTWPAVRPVFNQLSQFVDIRFCDNFWECHYHCYVLWDGNLGQKKL